MAPQNKPGQGGQEAPPGRPTLGFQKDVSEAPFPCGFHPRRLQPLVAGRWGPKAREGDCGRDDGTRARSGTGERGPRAAPAVVRGAEKPGTSRAAAATAPSRRAGAGGGSG